MGKIISNLVLNDYIKSLESLGIGEIVLTSIDYEENVAVSILIFISQSKI